MLERPTFIVRVHAPLEQPIVEDVATRELVRLPDLASILGELRRRLRSTDDAVALGLQEGSSAPPDDRP